MRYDPYREGISSSHWMIRPPRVCGGRKVTVLALTYPVNNCAFTHCPNKHGLITQLLIASIATLCCV